MIKTCWTWTHRVVTALLLLAVLGCAGVVLGLRYWILPNIEDFRDDIAASISEAAGQRVTIGHIAADWQRLRPHLVLRDVVVHDAGGRRALTLEHVENTLSWWTLVRGEIRLHSLLIDRPQLDIRRDPDGTIFVAGIAVNRGTADSGFADWVLRQRQIVVRGAEIDWRDGLRLAPPLTLRHVDFRLETRGRRHRFGLRATPPADLATPLDLRGDLKGESVRDLLSWEGSLYARIDNTDIAAWQHWLSLPFELSRGHGGLRMWLGFRGQGPDEVNADVQLTDVSARLGHDLPLLEMQALQGSLGWQRLAEGFELNTHNLSLQAADGLSLPPTDLKLQTSVDKEGRLGAGRVEARELNVGALAGLAAFLPLPAEHARRVAELAPQGTLYDLNVKWDAAGTSSRHYTAKARFAGLGLRPVDTVPGFANLGGTIDASDKGGVVSLDARTASVDLPRVFPDPLAFDSLTAQVAWKQKQDGLEVKINNAAFANGHVAGNAQGVYHTLPSGPGRIDLNGQITRADGRFVSRYLPLILEGDARRWLERAFLQGQGSDATLRLRGNLAEFPFASGKNGIFQVRAKVSGVSLLYADGWPVIDNIVGDLLFEGKRMEVNAQRGAIFGMRLQNVKATIPDLTVFDERVDVVGEAVGPTQEALNFIERSPVAGMIDHFTQGMQAVGNGALSLRLALPIRRIKDSRVSGAYQFGNNRVLLGGDLSPLEQVNGRLEFTESGVKIPLITAQLLGSPASVIGATQRDGTVRINAQGKFVPATARKAWPDKATVGWLGNLRGGTDWRASIVLRKKLADINVESTLQGLAVDLPAPLNKTAAEAVPFSLQRRIIDPEHDVVTLSYGRVMSAQMARREENGVTEVERGEVSFGAAGPARLPRAPGLWINGSLPALDLDQWRAFGEGGGGGSSKSPVAGINLKVGTLDAYGRRFHDLALNARNAGGEWNAQVQAQELAGDVRWNPEGRGRIVARLKHLTLPEVNPARAARPPGNQELPALDVAVESFELKRKKLGRLELAAVQEGADWRIQRLKLANPDSVLQADGVWLKEPSTRLNLKLDVLDLGKFLGRLGYPDTVKRGTAGLEGQLSWAGSPQDMDFASLTGNLTLHARDGQFLKIEPGIGKLFGIVSLQALPRRITLDFRDVFSDGFAFDEIAGTMRIAKGVLQSDDFRMRGPAAQVRMSGQTDLARETQQLKVRVTPLLGDSVSVAGALLGGPVVGLTTLILQKALKNPIDQLASYEYAVTGTWADPKVAKVQQKAPAVVQE